MPKDSLRGRKGHHHLIPRWLKTHNLLFRIPQLFQPDESSRRNVTLNFLSIHIPKWQYDCPFLTPKGYNEITKLGPGPKKLCISVAQINSAKVIFVTIYTYEFLNVLDIFVYSFHSIFSSLYYYFLLHPPPPPSYWMNFFKICTMVTLTPFIFLFSLFTHFHLPPFSFSSFSLLSFVYLNLQIKIKKKNQYLHL